MEDQRHTRSNILFNKFKKTYHKDLYLFAYFGKYSGLLELNFKSLARWNNIDVLSIPSAFRLIKDQIAQGPQIKIIFGRQISFNNLQCLYGLTGTIIKLNDNWYLYDVFSELQSYKVPEIFSKNVSTKLTKTETHFYKGFTSNGVI
jgi:hypothetical protein